MQSQLGTQRRERPEMRELTPVRTTPQEMEVAIKYARNDFESSLRNPGSGLSEAEIRSYLASFDRMLQTGEATFPRQIAEMAVDSFNVTMESRGQTKSLADELGARLFERDGRWGCILMNRQRKQ